VCPIGSTRNPATGRCVKDRVVKQKKTATVKKANATKAKVTATKAKVTATNAKVTAKAKAKVATKATNCSADEEISLKTGKCVKKCHVGSSRNPATGRCVKDKVDKPAKVAKTRKVARVPTPVRVPTPYQSPVARVPTPPENVSYMNPTNLPKSPSFSSSSSSSSLSPVIPMHNNKPKIQVPWYIDDVKEKKEIVIDKEMRKYLKEKQPNLTTPEELKEYIKGEIREFKNSVVTQDEPDFTVYLTGDDGMHMDADDVYHMSTDDFIKCLEHEKSPYYADYTIAKKYKKNSIKKLLDRIKFYLLVQEGLLIEHVNNGFTLKESLQHLTTEYDMTISPRMAHYVKFFLERGNKKDDSGDDDEEERSVSNNSYMSGEYSGDSYGLVGSKNVAPYRRTGRNGKNRSSSPW
jgi:hypothetical protein